MITETYCKKHGVEKTRHEFAGIGKIIYSCSVCGKEAEEKEAEAKKTEDQKKTQAIINKRLENAMIAPRFQGKTLEGYQTPTEGQKKALEVAKAFIENFKTTPGLILVGGPGTGKNHLAAGISFEVIHKGYTVLFIELSKAIRTVKESWRKDGEAESVILKSFLLPDLLVIDEVGVQFQSDTERLYLTEIINDRYNYLKPTILIGNLSAGELKALVGDRILDRFRDGGRMIVCDWKSYRGIVKSDC